MAYKGDWRPYAKGKPYTRIQVFLALWIPFISYFSYWTYAKYLAGDLACEGTACGTIFDPIFNIGAMAFVSGFLFYGLFSGLYLKIPPFTQPPWLDVHCPECGERDEPIAIVLCWDRLQGPFPCKECDRLFALESLAQPDWPWDDSDSHARKVLAEAPGPVIAFKPKVPFRLGPFVWRQSNPNFTSLHVELVKVIPVLLVIYGLQFFSVLQIDWDIVFVVVFLSLAFYIFVWQNSMIQEIRKAGEEIAEDVLEEMGLKKEDYRMPRSLSLIIQLTLVVIAIVLFILFPEFFEYDPL